MNNKTKFEVWLENNKVEILIVVAAIICTIIVVSLMVAGKNYGEQNDAGGIDTGYTTDSKKESGKTSKSNQKAIDLIADNLDRSNKFRLSEEDLTTVENPKGEGVIVFVQETRFNGVERNFIWVVIQDEAYATNSPSKQATPELPFPRDSVETVWSKTGLSMYAPASELIPIIY